MSASGVPKSEPSHRTLASSVPQGGPVDECGSVSSVPRRGQNCCASVPDGVPWNSVDQCSPLSKTEPDHFATSGPQHESNGTVSAWPDPSNLQECQPRLVDEPQSLQPSGPSYVSVNPVDISVSLSKTNVPSKLKKTKKNSHDKLRSSQLCNRSVLCPRKKRVSALNAGELIAVQLQRKGQKTRKGCQQESKQKSLEKAKEEGNVGTRQALERSESLPCEDNVKLEVTTLPAFCKYPKEEKVGEYFSTMLICSKGS